jgi:hypothetical protein
MEYESPRDKEYGTPRDTSDIYDDDSPLNRSYSEMEKILSEILVGYDLSKIEVPPIDLDDLYKENLRAYSELLFLSIQSLCLFDLRSLHKRSVKPSSSVHFAQVNLLSHILFDEHYSAFKTLYFNEKYLLTCRECANKANGIRGVKLGDLFKKDPEFLEFYTAVVRTFEAYSLNNLLTKDKYLKGELRIMLTDFWALCWMSCAFIDRPHAVFPSEGQICNTKHHEPFPFEDIEQTLQKIIIPKLKQ